MYQNLIHFKSQNIFLTLFSPQRTFALLNFSAIVNSCEYLCTNTSLCLYFEYALFYLSTPNMKVFQLSQLFASTYLVLLNNSHSNGCEVASHCGFDFQIFSVWKYFIPLFSNYISSWPISDTYERKNYAQNIKFTQLMFDNVSFTLYCTP